jgi:hypothetical protein
MFRGKNLKGSVEDPPFFLPFIGPPQDPHPPLVTKVLENFSVVDLDSQSHMAKGEREPNMV